MSVMGTSTAANHGKPYMVITTVPSIEKTCKKRARIRAKLLIMKPNPTKTWSFNNDIGWYVIKKSTIGKSRYWWKRIKIQFCRTWHTLHFELNLQFYLDYLCKGITVRFVLWHEQPSTTTKLPLLWQYKKNQPYLG